MYAHDYFTVIYSAVVKLIWGNSVFSLSKESQKIVPMPETVPKFKTIL